MEKEMPIGLCFSLVHRAFKKRLDERLSEFELTGVQFGVLEQLKRLREAGAREINQRDLENATHVTHPTMTEIIKRLEKKGFIQCSAGESDRRFKCIAPTEKAAAIDEVLSEVDRCVFQELSEGMSREQTEQVVELLGIMLKNAMSGCGKEKEEN